MTAPTPYLDRSRPPEQLTGGIRRIPVTTPKGEFSVRVKRVGSAPDPSIAAAPPFPHRGQDFFAGPGKKRVDSDFGKNAKDRHSTV